MSELRTFGGWRERRGFGVAGLSGTQTGGALLAVMGTLIVALLQPAVLTWIAFPLCAVFALVLVRVRGESLAGLIDKRVRLRVSGGVRRTSWDAPMPGMLEGLRVIEATDADGRQVGLVWMPGESLTALVPVEPLGTELVADEEVEAWMQGWSDWLAHLGYAAEVERVAVTVASGPTPVLPAQPTSDQLAAAVVTDLSAVARHMRSKTVVSLTLAAPDSSEVTARCAAVLELVGAGGVLARCGMSVLPAMSAEDVSLWVRQAFDPWLPEGPTTPADMRPTAVEERWATYRHDSAVSACYAWQEPPGRSLPRRPWSDCWAQRPIPSASVSSTRRCRRISPLGRWTGRPKPPCSVRNTGGDWAGTKRPAIRWICSVPGARRRNRRQVPGWSTYACTSRSAPQATRGSHP